MSLIRPRRHALSAGRYDIIPPPNLQHSDRVCVRNHASGISPATIAARINAATAEITRLGLTPTVDPAYKPLGLGNKQQIDPPRHASLQLPEKTCISSTPPERSAIECPPVAVDISAGSNELAHAFTRRNQPRAEGHAMAKNHRTDPTSQLAGTRKEIHRTPRALGEKLCPDRLKYRLVIPELH